MATMGVNGLTYESTDDLAEDDVFSVKPACPRQQDEELRAVRITTLIGHRHPTRGSVTQYEVLVHEPLPVDAAPCTNQNTRYIKK